MFIMWIKLLIMWICLKIKQLFEGSIMYTLWKRVVCLICLFILLINCGKVISAEEVEKRLVLVVVPDFSFQEVKWLKDHGQFPELWKTGGIAAMNIRPDGPYSYLNNMVSISSGVRGLGVKGWNAYNKGELVNGIVVDELYQQWTGKKVTEGQIFHPYISQLVDKNKETTYRANVGVLGQKLMESGVKRFVIGNSDNNEGKIRYGSLLTMNEEGATDGFLEAMKVQSGAPAGVVMDVDKIYSFLSTDRSNPSFIVIEWGDLARLYKQKDLMSQDYFIEQYTTTLNNLELFISELQYREYANNLMMLSPMVHSDSYQNKEWLAPFFYWQQPSSSTSMKVISTTTRQPFVISNLDVVPTILDFFNIDHANKFFGKPIQIKMVDEPVLNEAMQNIDLMFLIYKTRNVILSSYITILVILLVIVSIIMMCKDKKEVWKRAAKVLLVSGISSPFWLLITPYLLNYTKESIYLLILILCSFLTGYLFVKYLRNPILWISAILFVTISADLFIGNFFMRRSYLGYDPVIGARYYGIGNEYAGIYLISGLLLLESSKVRKWFVLLVLAVGQVFVLSSTNLGANAGATLSTGIMFGFFYYRYYFSSFEWKKLIIILGCLIPFILVILFLGQLNGKESHIGYAFSKLLQGDFIYITDTIKRKLEMNWKIFRFSNWTQLFVTTYLLIALYLWRGKRIVSDEIKKLLIQTGVVASIALLVLNDSGVVAAATSMFIIVCTSYYWALDH